MLQELETGLWRYCHGTMASQHIHPPVSSNKISVKTTLESSEQQIIVALAFIQILIFVTHRLTTSMNRSLGTIPVSPVLLDLAQCRASLISDNTMKISPRRKLDCNAFVKTQEIRMSVLVVCLELTVQVKSTPLNGTHRVTAFCID